MKLKRSRIFSIETIITIIITPLLYLNCGGGGQGSQSILRQQSSTPPSVSITSGYYRSSHHIDINLTFPRKVYVDTSNGRPFIQLTVGEALKQALYHTGDKTDTLVFRYTVQEDDNDIDGIDMNESLFLGGGQISYSTRRNIPSLHIERPDNLSSVKISNKGMLNITSSSSFARGSSIDIPVVFNEPISVQGFPVLALTIGNNRRQAQYDATSDDPSIIIFRYTIQANDENDDSIDISRIIDLNEGSIVYSADNMAISLHLSPPTNPNFTLSVDLTRPTISSSPTITSGNYMTGQNLDITLNFSENVNVDITRGRPSINLTIGSQSRQASYCAGTGSTVITFCYTVQTGDLDADGIGMASSILTNSGRITDVAGNTPTSLSFTAPDNLRNILINNTDHTSPTITSANMATGHYGLNAPIDITLTFSENVVVDGRPFISLTIGETTREAPYQSGSGSSSVIFRYIVQSGDMDANDGIGMDSSLTLNGGSINDIVGNNANLNFTPPTNRLGVIVDSTPPTITSANMATGHYGLNAPIDITLTFSENVVVDGRPFISLTIGETTREAPYQSGSGSSSVIFRYIVQSGDMDANDGIGMDSSLTLNGGSINDIVGNNANLNFTPPTNRLGVIVDSTPPVVNAMAWVPGNYITGETFEVRIILSKNVTVTGTPHINIDIGGQQREVVYSSGSGSTSLTFRYVIQRTDRDTDGAQLAGAITLSSGDRIVDTAGNSLRLLVPTITSAHKMYVNHVLAVATATLSDGNYLPREPLDVTLIFDDVMAVDTTEGRPRISLDIGETTVYAEYHSGSQSRQLVFRYTVQSNDNDTNGIEIVPRILLNGGTITNSSNNAAILNNSYFTIPINLRNITVGQWAQVYNGNYTENDNINVNVRFGENITVNTDGGTPRIDLNIGGNTKHAAYASGSGGKVLTFTYTVASGDSDADGIVMANSITLNGGVLTTASNTSLSTNFNSPENLAFVKVNTVMPFISHWRTTTSNETITLPLRAGHDYNFTVNWGDGSTADQITSDTDTDKSHTYSTAGVYTVTITGTVKAWYFNGGGDKNKIIKVIDLGSVGWENLERAFYACENLTTVSGGDLSSVTNMTLAFSKTNNLTVINSHGWNVGNVTNMEYTFWGAFSSNPNVRNWDVGNVTNMRAMFSGATMAQPDVSYWNVENVINMNGMFSAANLANPKVTNWNVGSVQNMSFMFNNAYFANPDVTNWNVGEVTNMGNMFSRNSANPNVTNWDVSNVTNMNGMFEVNRVVKPDVSNWDVSNVVDMSNMFFRATMANPDVSNWDIARVQRMAFMFYDASAANPNFARSNFSGITGSSAMRSMFSDTSALTSSHYSNLLTALESTNSNNGIRLDVPSGLGTSITTEAQSARSRLRTDHQWTIND